MNLPTSETIPDGFNTLPPNQKRRIRLVIKNASDSEISDFLQELRPRSNASLDYFLFLLLSAFIFFFAIVLDSPVLLFVAAITAPFNGPLIGTALAAVIPSWTHFVHSLLSLIATALVYFAAGWLAGMASQTSFSIDTIAFTYLLQSSWLEWLILTFAAGLTAWLFIRQDETPRLTSALLSYLIFFPLALSGLLLRDLPGEAWMTVLLMAAARLAVASFACLLGFWFAGLSTRHTSGWIIFSLILILGIFVAFKHLSNNTPVPQAADLLPTPTSISTTLSPAQTSTVTDVPATTIPSNTPAPTQTLTITLSPTATPIMAIVFSPSGVVVRMEPNSKASVVTYIDNGTEIQMLNEQMLTDTTLWEKVITPNGEIGWIVGRYLQTATPVN